MTKRQPAAAPDEIVRRDGALAPRSYDPSSNTVEVVWSTGARVRRQGWDGPFDEELDMSASAVRLERLNGGAPFLDTHQSDDLSRVIGSIVPGSARVANGIGTARVLLSRAASDADVVQKIRDGVIRNVSVGYRIHSVERVPRSGDVPLVRVTDWEPLEISAVPVPADAGAQVRAAPDHSRHHEEVAMPAPQNQNHEQDELATRAERVRAATVTDLASRVGLAEFGAEHVRAGTPVDRFRTLLLDKLVDMERAQHPGGPQQQIGAPIFATAAGASEFERRRSAAMENALLHRIDPAAFPLASGAENYVGLPLLEVARAHLEGRGVRTAGMSKMTLAGEALQQRSGMHATSDFSILLSGVVNKTLRASYEAAPQTWRPFTRITTVPDFKEVTRAQISEAPPFEKVNEHGEFKSGSMSDAGEKFRIETFGRIVAITRQALVNDDLSAFTRLPRAYGIQAAQLESDLVWSQILSNPVMADGQALFSVAHKNLLTPGAISETTVSEARLRMGLQTGLDGKTLLNVVPRLILVPLALQTQAEKFIAATFPTKSDDATPASLRALEVVAEPRLDAGIARYSIDGDAQQYFFAADPGQVDLIELAYLEGAQGVYTETRNGFNVDGVEIKVRMDAGAKVLDWRGLSSNAGASGD